MTGLYRFWDGVDALLYLGRTVSPDTRFRAHRGDKDWWPDVRKITIEPWLGTERDLIQAEREAIQAEKPRYNVHHNGAPAVRVTADQCDIDGCEDPVQARMLCRRHYRAWWKYGDPLAAPPGGRKGPRPRSWRDDIDDEGTPNP